MDIYITCKECSKKFLFTEHDIQYYKIQGWGPPKRCPACRKSRYKGLSEIIGKGGIKKSDFNNNPQNHAGIAPVGIPDPTNMISVPTQVIQLYCKERVYYLRVEQISRNKFTFLYLTAFDRASQFHKESDFQYILDFAMQHHPFIDSRVLYYPPCESNYVYVEDLKKMKYDGEWISRFHARNLYLHRYERLANYENDLSKWY